MTTAWQQRPILLTGARGQVGSHLLPLLRELGDVLAPGRDELDLEDEGSVRSFLRREQPRWIVNPAAYTAVDQAETERDLAFRINADAPRVLGEEAASLGVPVIHFSTDYVFSGAGDRPWTENDATDPQNVYGRSKLQGEHGLATSGAAHLILRTSWVYSATGHNFLRTMLRLTAEREELRIVDDQIGSPTAAASLARLTAHVIRRTEQAAAEGSRSVAEVLQPNSGVFHAVDAGFTSWFGFAAEIVRLASERHPAIPRARLVAIPSRDFPTPALRPLNSRMDTTKLSEQLGFSMRPWRLALAETMQAL